MISAAHARLIGRPIEEIATPALLVDIDILDANLARMADYFAKRPCKIRPHFKSHKSVELAQRQLAAGSCAGITCAKLSEAEQLVEGGVENVLIANQVIGRAKADRLAALNRTATVRCAVDSERNLADLGAAAEAAGVTIPVLVEVDVGPHRCGVPPGAPAIALARQTAVTPGVRFDGLQGFEAHLCYVEDAQKRAQGVRESFAPFLETRKALIAEGLTPAIVSCGSTGTYEDTGNIDGINELQCGTYALMDAKYARVRPDFKLARWVLATIISAHETYVVVDVGLKGIGTDMGFPVVEGRPEAKARYISEEHIPFDGISGRVGEKLRLAPLHGCTTHHLYREMFVARAGIVEDVWAIEGSGCLE